MVNIAMKKLTSDMFTPTNTSNNLVTVDIKTAKLKENIVQGMSSGVFSVLTNLVQNAKVNSITLNMMV